MYLNKYCVFVLIKLYSKFEVLTLKRFIMAKKKTKAASAEAPVGPILPPKK